MWQDADILWIGKTTAVTRFRSLRYQLNVLFVINADSCSQDSQICSFDEHIIPPFKLP